MPTTGPIDQSTTANSDVAEADPERSETPMPSGIAYVPPRSGQADSNGAEGGPDADQITVEPTTVDEALGDEVELSPGDVAREPVADLWPAHAAEALRERWRDLQLRFVEDPHNVAAEADFLVGEAIETLTGSLASLRADLSDWRYEGAGDTERLRVAVRRYHEFLNRILGL